MGITHCAPPKATSIDPGAMRTSGASQQAIGMGATDEGPGSSTPPPPHPPTPAPASAQPIVSSSGPWNEINK